MYEILEGPQKGKLIVKPQEKKLMDRLILKGIVREVKEEKGEPETKELKVKPETKEKKHRVSRKRKN
jgi:hypothetical protein